MFDQVNTSHGRLVEEDCHGQSHKSSTLVNYNYNRSDLKITYITTIEFKLQSEYV